MCVDFKFDPEAAFREKPSGRGFEPYPPPSTSSSPPGGSGVGSVGGEECDGAKASSWKGFRRRISRLLDWQKTGAQGQVCLIWLVRVGIVATDGIPVLVYHIV